MNRGFVVVVGVVAPGREVHPSWGPGRGGRVRWEPAGLVEDEGLADEMVQLLRERSPGVQARVVALRGLAAGLGGEAAERILDQLRNRTTAETARAHELEREAGTRCAAAAELLEVGAAAPGLARRPGVLQRRSRLTGGAAPIVAGPRPRVSRLA